MDRLLNGEYASATQVRPKRKENGTQSTPSISETDHPAYILLQYTQPILLLPLLNQLCLLCILCLLHHSTATCHHWGLYIVQICIARQDGHHQSIIIPTSMLLHQHLMRDIKHRRQPHLHYHLLLHQNKLPSTMLKTGTHLE